MGSINTLHLSSYTSYRYTPQFHLHLVMVLELGVFGFFPCVYVTRMNCILSVDYNDEKKMVGKYQKTPKLNPMVNDRGLGSLVYICGTTLLFY